MWLVNVECRIQKTLNFNTLQKKNVLTADCKLKYVWNDYQDEQIFKKKINIFPSPQKIN